jgi:hypothetical protein
LEITSPRPVPPGWRASELSAWLKAWNSARTSCGDRPMPVSCTLMRSCAVFVLVFEHGAHDDGAFAGELDRVAHQVGEDLLEPQRVAHQRSGVSR